MDSMQEVGPSAQNANYDIILENVNENREEFEEIHKNNEYYSGSEVAIITGLSKWKSPLKLWAEKTGRVEVQNEDSDSKFLGRILEDDIGQFFTRKTGLPVQPFNTIIRSKKYPWATGSPDFLVQTSGMPELAEAKSSGGYWQKEEWGVDKAPDAAHLQLQWYLMLTGLPAGYCIGLLGNSPQHFYYPRFERDDSLEDQIVSMVESFRALVKTDTPPAANAEDKKTIDDLYPRSGETLVIDAQGAVQMATEWKSYKDAEKAMMSDVNKYKESRTKIENEIKMLLKGKSKGIVGPYVISVKDVHNKGSVTEPFDYTTFSIKVADDGKNS